MVNLPTSPNISCGTAELPVAVVATYAGGLIPISGAKVDFSAGTFIFADTKSATTDILGLAQACHQAIRQVTAYIQKSGIDFGSGVGVRHIIGNSGLRTGPYMFPKVIARTQAPGVTLPPISIPCVGTITADTPNFQSILSGITTIPSNISVPIRVTGSRTSIPMKITVDGREVERRDSGFTSLNIINVLNAVGADFGASHTIRIESLATDCSIPPATITVPPLRPTGLPSEMCSQVATTVDSVNHPSEITDLMGTFYVYLRGIKEVCKTDPTNPAFIKKLPSGTMGKITLGNLSTDFFLTGEGITDIDLSKLIDLKSLSGAPSVPSFGVPTPQPSVIQPPAAPAPPTMPTGKLNGNVAAAQDYINRYYPGKGTAQPDDPGWARFGSVKIVRTNRSYFHTQTLQDIGRLI